jgi:hypothetical protein
MSDTAAFTTPEAKILNIADWLSSQVNDYGGGPEEPPQPASEFDYYLAQAVSELRSIASLIAAPAEGQQAAPAADVGQELLDMEARKDAAYLERNQCVALIARMALALGHRAGIARTAIEGWSNDWHGCVYIDLPTGQASWHFHDSQAGLFAGLPAYTGAWDGHDTPEKYRRVGDAWRAARAPAVRQPVAHAHIYSDTNSFNDNETVMRCRVVFADPLWKDRQKDGATVALYTDAPQADPPPSAAAPAVQGLSDAERDVLAERRRQVEVEGWTPEHDDEHATGGMAYAAAAYAVSSAEQTDRSFFITSLWAWTGWSRIWFKPKSPRADLVRAGALIVAEIERLDRAARALKTE